MKGLIFSFQLGPRAGLIRAAWPLRTSAGPLVAFRARTGQSGGQVKGHDRRVPAPALSATGLLERPPLTLQGRRAGRGRVPAGAGPRGGDQAAEEYFGKCSSVTPVSVATWAVLVRLRLQLPGVCGSGCGVHAQWAPHCILSGEERVMSPASW